MSYNILATYFCTWFVHNIVIVAGMLTHGLELVGPQPNKSHSILWDASVDVSLCIVSMKYPESQTIDNFLNIEYPMVMN